MAITEATTEDWVDFWENEDVAPATVTMTVADLNKMRDELKEQVAIAPVSYTHLTLPTICSV